jgi:hypothetical protein
VATFRADDVQGDREGAGLGEVGEGAVLKLDHAAKFNVLSNGPKGDADQSPSRSDTR